MNKDTINKNNQGPMRAVRRYEEMLDLLSAQINSALHDLESPQREITIFFDQVNNDVDRVSKLLLNGDSAIKDRECVDELLRGIKKSAIKSIIEFQSFDRVEQRLRNVKESLHILVDHFENTDGKLLDLIKSTYSLEHEFALHRMAEGGASRNQLLSSGSENLIKAQEDDIELF